MRLGNTILCIGLVLGPAPAPLLAADPHGARAHVTLADLAPADQADVLELAEVEVRRVLRRQDAEGHLKAVQLERGSNLVQVDLARAYLPTGSSHVPASLEEDLHAVSTAVLGLTENALGVTLHGVVYTFDGRELRDYFPGDFPPEEPSGG